MDVRTWAASLKFVADLFGLARMPWSSLGLFDLGSRAVDVI